MKYVMLEGKNTNGIVQKVPIMFPDFMVHKVTANFAIAQLTRWHDFEDVKVVSAGQVYGTINAVGGESESCKVKSAPDDAEIIDDYREYEISLALKK